MNWLRLSYSDSDDDEDDDDDKEEENEAFITSVFGNVGATAVLPRLWRT